MISLGNAIENSTGYLKTPQLLNLISQTLTVYSIVVTVAKNYTVIACISKNKSC